MLVDFEYLQDFYIDNINLFYRILEVRFGIKG